MDHLRRQSAALAADAAVREWLVVANGNADLVRAAAPAFALPPRVVALSANTGSAIGFGTGIAAAFAEPANLYLLLLDEDNLPEADTASRLLAMFESERERGNPALMVAAYRDRAHAAQARGIDIRRPDSSIGFHVADLPAKLLRRLTPPALPSRRIAIRTSAYGGLFLDRTALESVGLPRPDFVLYGDDTEWTLRMTAAGATIVLDPEIGLADMDATLHEPSLFSFAQWLSVAEDFRLYYGARNEAWLDTHRFARHPVVYRLNRTLVRLVLRLYARTAEQRRGLALFCAAAADGEAGLLGPNPLYPLPEAQP